MSNFVEKISLDLLNEELLTIANKDAYSDYNFHIVNDFDKVKNECQVNDVYLVISVDDGTIGHGSVFVNARVSCITHQKNIEKVREYFNDFTLSYNLQPKSRSNAYIIQSYTTPATISNFNRIQNEYATIVYIDCSFSISQGISVVEKIELYNGSTKVEDLDFLQVQLGYVAANDSKSFPYTNNAYTKSIIQFGTNSFTIQAYFKTSSQTISDCLTITTTSGAINQDKVFKFVLTISGSTYTYDNMKLLAFNVQQTPESLPVCIMSFSQ